MKVVKVFFYRHDAEMARGLLSEAGIEAIVSADDAGGFRPDLTFGMGNIRLLVQDSDLGRAQEILKVLEVPVDQVEKLEIKVRGGNKKFVLLSVILIFILVLFYLFGSNTRLGMPILDFVHQNNIKCKPVVSSEGNIEVCREFYTDGTVRWEGQFIINGPASGSHKSFFHNGQLESESFYQNGWLEGELKVYFENGQVQWFENYKNGKLEGEIIEYYESGKSKRISTYKDGKLQGNLKTYYENGELMEDLFFVDGKRVNDENLYFEGVDKTYYQSGKLWEEYNYQEGLIQGVVREYFESGQLKIEANFRDDKYDGSFKEFYENGILKKENFYSNNIPTKERLYNRSGKLIFRADY